MSDHQDEIPEFEAANDAGPPEAESLAAIKAENAELKDRLLRALADAENIRRRSERERREATQYAVTGFARDILAVADNFARAIGACPAEARESASPQVKAVIEGVEVTERQLLSTLERYGIRIVDTSDGKFDPHFHQAIAEVPGEGKPPGAIVDVVQTGYVIEDRLLRPAMVTVARRDVPAGAAGEATGQSQS